MNRRSFILGAVSIAASPAVLAAAPSPDDALDKARRDLRKKVARDYTETRPLLTLYGDGIHDDTIALQAMFNGAQVLMPHRGIPGTPEPPAVYLLTDTVTLPISMEGGDFTFINAAPYGRPILQFPAGGRYSNCGFTIKQPRGRWIASPDDAVMRVTVRPA